MYVCIHIYSYMYARQSKQSKLKVQCSDRGISSSSSNTDFMREAAVWTESSIRVFDLEPRAYFLFMVFQQLLSHQQLSQSVLCLSCIRERKEAADYDRPSCVHMWWQQMTSVKLTAEVMWHQHCGSHRVLPVMTRCVNWVLQWQAVPLSYCATVEYDLHRGVFHIKAGRLTLLNMSDVVLPQWLFWENNHSLLSFYNSNIKNDIRKTSAAFSGSPLDLRLASKKHGCTFCFCCIWWGAGEENRMLAQVESAWEGSICTHAVTGGSSSRSTLHAAVVSRGRICVTPTWMVMSLLDPAC